MYKNQSLQIFQTVSEVRSATFFPFWSAVSEGSLPASLSWALRITQCFPCKGQPHVVTDRDSQDEWWGRWAPMALSPWIKVSEGWLGFIWSLSFGGGSEISTPQTQAQGCWSGVLLSSSESMGALLCDRKLHTMQTMTPPDLPGRFTYSRRPRATLSLANGL